MGYKHLNISSITLVSILKLILIQWLFGGYLLPAAAVPFLAMRPATVNCTESLAAPLPLSFHCSSLSLRIFILSARDILAAPTSVADFCVGGRRWGWGGKMFFLVRQTSHSLIKPHTLPHSSLTSLIHSGGQIQQLSSTVKIELIELLLPATPPPPRSPEQPLTSRALAVINNISLQKYVLKLFNGPAWISFLIFTAWILANERVAGCSGESAVVPASRGPL